MRSSRLHQQVLDGPSPLATIARQPDDRVEGVVLVPDEPGWYPNPDDPMLERYWDGTSWTVQVRTALAAPSRHRTRRSGAIFGHILLYVLFWGGLWFVLAHGDADQQWAGVAALTLFFVAVVVVFMSLVAAIRFGAYLTRVRHLPVALAALLGAGYWLAASTIGVVLWPLALWLSERHDLFRDEDDLPSLGALDEFDGGAALETVRSIIEWALIR